MIPQDSVMIGHEYLHHAGPEWCGKLCLPYHMYLIRNDVQLMDVIALYMVTALSIVMDREIDDTVRVKEEIKALEDTPSSHKVRVAITFNIVKVAASAGH